MNFTAIDFETANSLRSSICSIGICVVKNGRIAESKHILFKPVPNYYEPMNTMIHGISYMDTVHQKTFSQRWKELKPFFHNQTLVAHNAAFDCSVLRKTLEVAEINFPDLEYHCSYRLSAAILDRLPTHKLSDVSRFFKIELNHHNAESDARACAQIIFRLCEMNKVSSLEELSSDLGFSTGKINEDQSYKPFSRKKGIKWKG